MDKPPVQGTDKIHSRTCWGEGREGRLSISVSNACHKPGNSLQKMIVLLLVFLGLRTGTTQSLSLNNFLMTGPKAHLAFAESVAAGAQLSMEECRYQFRWDRWDCPHSATSVFSSGRARASREMAFVQAVSAAGVVYTLTRNCSVGDFDKCGCDNRRKGTRGGRNWKWGGCSDNIRFGERISKLFVDALETGNDARAIINLHNIEAGRRAVRRTTRLLCKCHGVSGACTTKTCWQQLADLRTVGSFLRRKYDKAVKVDFHNGVLLHNKKTTSNQYPKMAHLRDMRRIRKTDLVYFEKSPDYCKKNQTLGVKGSLGRECKIVERGDGERVSRQERRSCQVLCTSCGFHIRRKQVHVRTKCNCKFVWCCEVRCQTCDVVKNIYTCTL